MVEQLPPALRRPFAIIAFDWDGTAVPDRHADASAVTRLLDALLLRSVSIVIITGTHLGNVDSQCCSLISGPQKRHLFACTNRGSEVFGFDEAGRPVRVAFRQATPREDALLTEIAEAVRDELGRRGLDVQIIYDRLNRRKIDLIPLPEWRDPPKAVIDDLLAATEERLRRAGIGGGIREAFRLAQELSSRLGLDDARITTDVKHIEVGLTDKSDSVDWIVSGLAAAGRIPTSDILILGDEFGPIAGFEGSDARMLVASAKGATFVSVGKEPNGVPEEVIPLGGGPEQFCKVLEVQCQLRPMAKDPPDPPAWLR
jgi:hypothetical protein